jgi:hypothetical protein
MIENFKKMAKNILHSKEKFDDEFSTFSTYLMPEYEKNYI